MNYKQYKKEQNLLNWFSLWKVSQFKKQKKKYIEVKTNSTYRVYEI